MTLKPVQLSKMNCCVHNRLFAKIERVHRPDEWKLFILLDIII